jgi:hypothetical protein
MNRQRGPVLWRQAAVVSFGDSSQAQLAGFTVAGESRRSDHLSHFPGGHAPQGVHLEQPVLRRHIALHEEGVGEAGGHDVRHAQRIPGNHRTARDRSFDNARGLRQRPPRVPIGRYDQYEQGRANCVVEIS